MNKIFTKIATACAGLAMAIGVGVAIGNNANVVPAKAADEAYATAVFTSANQPNNSSYTGEFENTTDGFTWVVKNFNNNDNGWNGQIKCGRKKNTSVATITTKNAVPVAITKASINICAVTTSKVNSIKLYGGSSASTFIGSFTVGNGEKEVAIPAESQAANQKYKFEFDCASNSSNGFIAIDSVKLFYNPNSGKTLSGISITTAPAKTKYVPTESFDPTGMVVTAAYSDNTTSPVDLSECTISPTVITASGNVTVTYEEKTATQAVTVYGVSAVTGVADGHPTEVRVGTSDLTKDDVFVNVLCDDSVTRTVHPTSISYDFSSVGNAVVTCTYSYATGTKTATFNVNVINPGDGTESNPYSVDEAIAFIDTLDSGATSTNKIYVKGIVSSSTAVTTDKTGSYRDVFLFNKAGVANSFEFYRTYLDEGLTDIPDAANSIQYYEVVGCGYGTYFANNSTYELKSVKIDNVYDNVYLKSANAPTVVSVEANIAAGTYYTGHTLDASDFSVTANFTNGKPSGTVTEGFTWTVNGVENGTLAEGTNSVIVYLGDKHSATISVTGTTTHATDLSLTESTKTVYIGTPVTLGIEVEPEGYVDTVVWESSDTSVATVNQNGVVTGVSAGTAEITAYITNVNGTMSDTCTVTVAADYVTTMGWSGTSASQFGPFYSNSGAQLTKAITDTWNVSATWQGRGTVENLKFGDYTLKLGDKTISTLPYTYAVEDDGQALKIVYGTASSGQPFEKGNGTAKPNIVQSLNTISKEISGSDKITNFVAESTITLPGVSGNTGGAASATKNGITITSDGGYFTNSQFRIYTGKTFTVNATGTIKTIALTFDDTDHIGLESSYTVNSNTFTRNSSKQSRISTIVIEYEAGTQTVYFNDQTGHENTQRAVVRFATFLNETMGKDGICGTSVDNYGVHDSTEFASAWLDVAAKYDELFGSGENALKGDELAFAKNMLAGCEAKWNDSPDVLQRAMKTYDYVVTYYSAELIAEGMTTPNFMLDADGQTPLRAISTNGNGQLQLFGNSADSEMITVIVVMSAIATICAGGFFFYRRRKEQQ